MVNLFLFIEFFKIGLFAVGGGYATIPFLFHLSETHAWFTKDELINMIAISNITPGPIGINMATYSGFTTSGLTGSVVSTMAIVLSPFIVTLITIYFLEKFKNSKFIKTMFNALRPTSCALLSCVMIQLAKDNILKNGFSLSPFVITLILFIIYPKVKSRPSLVILIGALLGVIFQHFNLF